MILENFVHTHNRCKWEIPVDFLSRSHFERSLLRLDMSSSPGYPYMRKGTTNSDYFRNGDGSWREEVVNYVWEIVQQRLEMGHKADPIRLFVKQEPHSIKKIDNKRYRLISSVSVVDQIIDHMLFGDLNDLLIENWMYVPSKVGWSYLHGGWKMMPPNNKGWVAIDKSAWDWTVQLWMVDLVLMARLKLCVSNSEIKNTWYQKALYRYRQLYLEAVFITSGGLVLKQIAKGVQKSGCVNTIADNSMMQYLLHLRVSYEMGIDPLSIMCMGDDTFQQEPADLSLYLQNLGQFCLVKQAEQRVEFAGFRFLGYRIEPSYLAKHAFNLLFLNPKYEKDVGLSYSLMYHRSHKRQWIRGLFEEMGVDIPSLEWCDAIFDGEI